MNKFGCKPELEVYDVGHIYNLAVMKNMGLIQGKPYLQFVMGVMGGIAANNKTLLMMKDAADECFGDVGYEWSALGTGKNEFPICTQNILLGGHCRVGMEDNLFLSKGRRAANNGELVQKMVNIISQLTWNRPRRVKQERFSESSEALLHKRNLLQKTELRQSAVKGSPGDAQRFCGFHFIAPGFHERGADIFFTGPDAGGHPV
jgi:hypothetical protein